MMVAGGGADVLGRGLEDSQWCAEEWAALSRRAHGLGFGATSQTAWGGRNAGQLYQLKTVLDGELSRLAGPSIMMTTEYFARGVDLSQPSIANPRIIILIGPSYRGAAGHGHQVAHDKVQFAGDASLWSATPNARDPRHHLPDWRTSLERKLGIDPPARSSPPPPPEALCRGYAIVDGRGRRLSPALTALVNEESRVQSVTRILSSLKQLLRNINKLVKAIARLRSLCGAVGPEPPEPPGQLLTASPHVTRGPTTAQERYVLPVPRRLQLT